MNGSSVKREGEKLKKIGLECSDGVSRHSYLMFSEKERYFPSFFFVGKHQGHWRRHNAYDIAWFSVSEIQKIVKLDLRSLEPLVLSKVLKQGLLPVAEYSEYKVNASIISHVQETDNVPKSSYESLLELAGFVSEAQKLIYYDFMCHVYPCETMNIFMFKKYLKSFNWWSDELISKNFKLLFSCHESEYTSWGSPAEIRCRYIFRYYDSNNDGALETSELRSMISDINTLKDVILDDEQLDKAVEEHAKTFQLQDNTVEKLNGTFKFEKKYDLATHSVKVRRSGTLVGVNSLWDMEGTAALSKSVKLSSKLRIERVSSVDSFNLQSQANEMLQGFLF
ncbi:uncharacterized protein CEXT_584891 [Caerostris extrusa]|uniref:EF-hand domain-containing protein n=1 Tax=Caerostris extrusa TaxID=172846 RepID=A0AAV4SRK6_CAEEX|nr:uncharacterized protein CEXT_584891 [Caerostris extrusa]